ncbi:MAG: sodium-independent anion transporter, partial [Phototrophicales bacterium]
FFTPLFYFLPNAVLAAIIVVIFTSALVAIFHLNETSHVSIVGTVPSGLPNLTIPIFDLERWQQLLPFAVTISLVGYMESISVAKSLASRRRQKVDANQELIALGAANLGAAFTGAYPIAGGFARSMVNFSSGANTGLASMITASLMLITVLFFTPLFYFLPNAVLAAIIVVAVSSLIDLKTFVHTWQYSKIEGITFLATFLAVLIVGVETGILIGVGVSLALYLWHTSRPHIAVLGRLGESEEYRNILRHQAYVDPHILALRVDESLYFPNAQFLEEVVLTAIADNPQIRHFVLVCSAVNFIDTSALEILESLAEALENNQISFNLAAVKGPVMDRLAKVGFVDRIGRD